ncbi:MAG: hypothetical protein FD143_2493 [Ignavibacteria bacterium]|nr:MAG: hypothetical protein FD143_2493 [Ignavibacteria bacterium]KAF0156687.1 MAG: hypothetical protein FD188_2897 [Ignavibacteria bacterium]
MKRKNLLKLLTSILVVIFLSACGSSNVVQNNWRSNEITIDGNYQDWKNNLKLLPDQKISLGFTNDDKFFYMCLVTEDRMKVMQMTRGGFITWFIPSSGSENTFGIKYPLPIKNMPREQMQSLGREMFLQGGLDKIVNMMIEKQNEIQILNSDKYSLSLLPAENKDGIKARLGYIEGKFVYELQVPLAVHDDFAFQIASLPGDNLQVKFETEQVESQAGRGTGPGMMQGGGMRPGGGNMPRFQMPEPLNYSVELKLAEKK